MNKKILNIFEENRKSGKRCLAVLLDPDKLSDQDLSERIEAINAHKVDFVL